MAVDGIVVHEEPVWRDRADFIIRAPIEESAVAHAEQLWARKIREHVFEICCIPVDIYDLALGDIVETDGSYTIRGIVQASGRYVFRVWFGETENPPRQEVFQRLIELGALNEWSSQNLLAVDARDFQHAQIIADFLSERERLGHLVFETGRTHMD